MTIMLRKPVIRPMDREDLVEVLAVERETYTPPWSEENFLSELRNPHAYAFIAHEGRRLLGYLAFWMVGCEVHLLNLTIPQNFRGCGMGKEFMSFLMDFSYRHGAKWIGLEVRESNRTAVALYRSFGFEQKRVRRGYYKDGYEDAIVMERELDYEPIGTTGSPT